MITLFLKTPKKIKVFLLLVLIFSIMMNQGFAQKAKSKSDIKGYVKDVKTGEALPYANIIIQDTNRGTITNTDGYFVLVNVPVGLCSLQVDYIGYKSQTIELQNVSGGLPIFTVEMEPSVIELEGVMVTAQAEMLDVSSKQISQITFSPRQLASLPSIGEVDVFRTMQLLPGISGATEGESGLYVRGGTPDQNLVLFDGMTIYHVDHFFGFFSAFNADAIKDIQLYKGGFPAEYGGRISSVVDLTGKSGNKNKPQFGYGINLLSAHAFFETPLWDKGTFLVAGRRSYTDFIRSPLYDSIYGLMTGEEDGGATGGPVNFGGRGGGRMGGSQMEGEFIPSFYFYDLNSKLTLNPTSKDILTFSFYTGKDDLDKSQDFGDIGFKMRGTDTEASLQTTDFTRWGNLGFSGKWSRQWHDRFHVDLLAASSEYFSEYDRSADMTSLAPANQEGENQRRGFANTSDEDNTVKDMSYKLNADWQIAQSHRLGFGLHASKFDNSYTATRNDTIEILSRKNKSWLYSAYVQDKWKISNLELTLGLRSSLYENTNNLYHEPRFSLNYQLTKNLQLKGAWGQYYQFVSRVANEDVTQGARDFWLLADEDIDPSYSEHFIAGVNYENDNYVFGIEAYQKNLDDLIEFSRRYVSVGPKQSETIDNFFFGTGQVRGIEFLAQKKRGALTGWIGYTLGKVDYVFPGINNGDIFPANHDRRHEVNAVAKLNLGVWTLAATWVFASGSPYTAPESQYYIPYLDGEYHSYIHVSDKNSFRLPDYHRLDLSASRRFSTGNWSTEVGVSIFNAYNHKNVWYRDYNLDTTPITVTDVMLLGFTPTIYLQMNLK
ncbi:TonB-dependent receptor [candidate division KSB1 bacterium]|nr:TonB-dependent receptor [candidate division KSB1 bacterium]